MQINTTDAQALFTKKIVDVYAERPKPTSFLRSFAKVVESPTKEVSIEVQRGTEKVSVDVVRGTDGIRNQTALSSEKIFIPPYHREYFDITQLQLYDRLFGATTIDDSMFAMLINSIADQTMLLQNKIERAIELQIATVFTNGTLNIESGTDINFKRKSTSIVDLGSGQYFTSAIDPFAKIEAGCTFIRTKGKAQGGTYNAIFGTQAWAAFLANSDFQSRQNLVNMSLDSVNPPQRNAIGGVYHGQITCGSYKVNCWTYPEYYDTATASNIAYIPETKVILLPENPKFVMNYAAVPQLINPGVAPKVGAFIVSDYIDQKAKTHEVHVESAPLFVPTAIDQIYTMKVVGG